MKKLMTITEVAVLTGISVTTLRRAVKSGRIPAIRAGGSARGKLLFDINLVQQFLTQEAMSHMSADRGGDGWDDDVPALDTDHDRSGLARLFDDQDIM